MEEGSELLGRGEQPLTGRFRLWDTERWSELSPQPGMVLEVELSDSFCPPRIGDVGRFMILKVEMREDRTFILEVASLGAQDPVVSRKLNKLVGSKNLIVLPGSDGAELDDPKVALHAKDIGLMWGEDFPPETFGYTGRKVWATYVEQLRNADAKALIEAGNMRSEKLAQRQAAEAREAREREMASKQERSRYGMAAEAGFEDDLEDRNKKHDMLRERIKTLRERERSKGKGISGGPGTFDDGAFFGEDQAALPCALEQIEARRPTVPQALQLLPEQQRGPDLQEKAGSSWWPGSRSNAV